MGCRSELPSYQPIHGENMEWIVRLPRTLLFQLRASFIPPTCPFPSIISMEAAHDLLTTYVASPMMLVTIIFFSIHRFFLVCTNSSMESSDISYSCLPNLGSRLSAHCSLISPPPVLSMILPRGWFPLRCPTCNFCIASFLPLLIYFFFSYIYMTYTILPSFTFLSAE